jgi:hypothetical protein
MRIEVDEEDYSVPLLCVVVKKKKGGLLLDRNQLVDKHILYETDFIA